MTPSVRHRYDVIVVGGGPAGVMAAKICAEGGFSVLLLEKDREIGLPVRCGELVGSRGFRLAIEPHPSWITHTVKAVTFVSPTGVRITVPSPDEAYMLDRPRMEQDIAQMAVRSGTHLLTQATAVDLLFSDKGRTVSGVRILHGGRVYEVVARLVFATDGVESRMAKLAGLSSAITNLDDIGICAQYFVSGIDSPDGSAELHFGKNIVPDCYAWMFPKKKGTANLGLGIRASSAGPASPVELLDRFMKFRFPKAKIIRRTVGAVPLGLYLPKLTRNGFLTVGDAARMANCLDGGGINYALNAAKMAGRVALNALQADDTSVKRLKAYDREWQKSIGKQQIRTYKLKNAVLKVKDPTIEAAARVLREKSSSDIGFLDILKLTIKNQPALLLEAIKLFK